ncbi:MAG: hypothetical protein J0H82_06715 [Alphaproteobacteria bacterium]|jgi:hypothetical protein|nr:hypothetical protein [Alphaproteobacteria bacterium]
MTDDTDQTRVFTSYKRSTAPVELQSQRQFVDGELSAIEKATRAGFDEVAHEIAGLKAALKEAAGALPEAQDRTEDRVLKRVRELMREITGELTKVKAEVRRIEEVRVAENEAFASITENLGAEIRNARVQSRAELQDERTARAGTAEAMARHVESLSASFSTATSHANARIATEEEVRASETEAVATRLQTTEASFASQLGIVSGRIDSEAAIRASADGVLSQNISTVSATAGTKNRTFVQSFEPVGSFLTTGDLWFDTSQNYRTRRYTGSFWEDVYDRKIDLLSSSVTTLTEATVDVTRQSSLARQITALQAIDSGSRIAAIETEMRTVAGPGGTEASFSTRLNTRFNGIEGSIQNYASTAATVNGIANKWGVRLNANGHIAGIEILNSSSGTAKFAVSADDFELHKPGVGGWVPFKVETSIINGVPQAALTIDGSIYCKKVIDGSVNTQQIAPGAVSNAVATPTTSTPYLQTNGGYVLVMATCKVPMVVVGEGQGIQEVTVYLQRNGTNIYTKTGAGTVTFFYVDYGVGTGSYSYSLIGGTGVLEPMIAAIELRR